MESKSSASYSGAGEGIANVPAQKAPTTAGEGGVDAIRSSGRSSSRTATVTTMENVTSLPCRARLKVLSATNLAAADSDGFSDPYAKCFINNQYLGRTETVHKNLNPEWQHIPVPWFYLRDLSAFVESVVVRVEVWDSDITGSDDFLGAHTIAGGDLIDLIVQRKHELKGPQFWYPGYGKSDGNAFEGFEGTDSLEAGMSKDIPELELDTLPELAGTCMVSVSGNIRICIEYETLADCDSNTVEMSKEPRGSDRGSIGPSSLTINMLGGVCLPDVNAYLKLYINGKLVAHTDVADDTINPTWNYTLSKHPIFDTQLFRSSGTVRVEAWSSKFPDADHFLGATGFTGKQILKIANGRDRFSGALQRDDEELNNLYSDLNTSLPRVILVFDQHYFNKDDVAFTDELLVSSNLHSRTMTMLNDEMRLAHHLAFNEISIRLKQRATVRFRKVIWALAARKLRRSFFLWYRHFSRHWLQEQKKIEENEAPDKISRMRARKAMTQSSDATEFRNVRATNIRLHILNILIPNKTNNGKDAHEDIGLVWVRTQIWILSGSSWVVQNGAEHLTSRQKANDRGGASFHVDEEQLLSKSVLKKLRNSDGSLDMGRLKIEFEICQSGHADILSSEVSSSKSPSFSIHGKEIWRLAPKEFEKSRSRGILLKSSHSGSKLFLNVTLDWGDVEDGPAIDNSLTSSSTQHGKSHRCSYCVKHNLEISTSKRSEASKSLKGCLSCGLMASDPSGANSNMEFNKALLGLEGLPQKGLQDVKKLELRKLKDHLSPKVSKLAWMRKMLEAGEAFEQQKSLDLSIEAKKPGKVVFRLESNENCRDLEFVLQGNLISGVERKGVASTSKTNVESEEQVLRIRLRDISTVGQGLPPILIDKSFQKATRQSTAQRKENNRLNKSILYVCYLRKREQSNNVQNEEILSRREWLILRHRAGDAIVVKQWADAIRMMIARHEHLVVGLRRFLVKTNRAMPQPVYVMTGKGQYTTVKKLCTRSMHICTSSESGCFTNAVANPQLALKERLENRTMRFEFSTVSTSIRPFIYRNVADLKRGPSSQCIARAAPTMYWLRKDLSAYLKELVESPDVPSLSEISPFWKALAGSGRNHLNFSTYYPGDIVQNKWRQFAVHLLSLLPQDLPSDACLHVRPGHAPLDPNTADKNGDYLNYNVGQILYGDIIDKKVRRRAGVLAASSKIKLVAGEITKMVADPEDAFDFLLTIAQMRVNRNHAVRDNTPYNDHKWLSQSAIRAGLIYDHVWSQLESIHISWNQLNGPASRPGATRNGHCIVNIDDLCKAIILPEVKSHQFDISVQAERLETDELGRGKSSPQWDYQERSIINSIEKIMSLSPDIMTCQSFISNLKLLVNQSELFLDPNVAILGKKILLTDDNQYDEDAAAQQIFKESKRVEDEYLRLERDESKEGVVVEKKYRQMHWVRVKVSLKPDSIAPINALAPSGSLVIQGTAKGILLTPLTGESIAHITIIPTSGLFHNNDHLTIVGEKGGKIRIGEPGPEHKASLPRVEIVGSELGRNLCELRGCLSNITRDRFIYCFTHTYTSYLVFREEDQQRVDSNSTWQKDKKALTSSQLKYLDSHFFGKDMPEHLECIFTLAATHFLLKLLRGESCVKRPDPERFPPYPHFSLKRENMHKKLINELHTEIIHRLGPILQGATYSREMLQAAVVDSSWECTGPAPRHLLVPTEAEEIEVMYESGAKGTDKEYQIEREVHADDMMAADKGEITYHLQYNRRSEMLPRSFRDERPTRVPLRYLEFDQDLEKNVQVLHHLSPAKLFLRHAFKKLAMNAAGVVPADLSCGFYKGANEHYKYKTTKEQFVCGAFDSMIEKIPRIRVETQKLKPSIKVWQDCHKKAVQIGLHAKVTYQRRAESLMAKVGVEISNENIEKGAKFEVDVEQKQLVLEKLKEEIKEALLEKRHWDQKVDEWHHKLAIVKPIA